MLKQGGLTNQKGLTLIELLIVVAIIGIIAAVGYPAYLSQAEKTRRTEGTTELTRLMDLQERYYINNFPTSYTANLGDLGPDPGATVTTDSGHYIISAAACAGETITQCVQLTAAAQPSQVNDGDLTLDSRGQRTRDGDPGWD